MQLPSDYLPKMGLNTASGTSRDAIASTRPRDRATAVFSNLPLERSVHVDETVGRFSQNHKWYIRLKELFGH